MQRVSAVISSGGTASTEIKNNHLAVMLIEFPTMTGTAATLTGSNDGYGTSGTLGDKDGNLSITSPSTRSVAVPAAITMGCTSFKIVSGSAEGADRTIYITLNDFAG